MKCIGIKIPNVNMTIINVYKPPKLSIVHFITHDITFRKRADRQNNCPSPPPPELFWSVKFFILL